MMKYFCCSENRRELVRAHATLNGIDYLEVKDDQTMVNDDRQRLLVLHFLKAHNLESLRKENFRLTGRDSVKRIGIKAITLSKQSDEPNVVIVEVDRRGDFSNYTLQLVDVDNSQAGFDPILSAVDVSFKVNCPTDFDCQEEVTCAPSVFKEPDLNYLAKDFNSFRQLMLDRLSEALPEWREQSPADLMQALVDLKAYVADYQSYQQDAIATEAYLGTARRRISVRRHVRLVDYFMHDGCNARTWVHVRVDPGGGLDSKIELPKQTPLFTRVPNIARRLERGTEELRRALSAGPIVFETMHTASLYARHNRICFYSWGEEECCLPRGATRATLEGHYPNLKKGDFLILEEVRGPQTGSRQDADLRHRHPVRLVKVSSPQADPLTGTKVTQVEWHSEDSLPFPLTISSKAKIQENEAEDEGDNLCHEAFGIARGNIVLCDHGRTIVDEDLGKVPEPRLDYAVHLGHCQHLGKGREIQSQVPIRFRPRLREKPLTQAVPYGPKELDLPARALVHYSPADAVPAIHLNSRPSGQTGSVLRERWHTQLDLLSSDNLATDFVVEIEEDGTPYLRFGDDKFGMRPNEGTTFEASYRIGNGTSGNIGAEALYHVVTNHNEILEIRNPMPGFGGIQPETITEARLKAPHAYRQQERAVTPEDYAAIAERHPEVQRAVATFRWTGSWHTVFLTVDRVQGREIDADFEKQLRAHLERFRMMGYDLEVDGPRYVPLEIEMEVCVRPDYFRGDVRRALLEVFRPRLFAYGQRGVFHPDNLTFGQSVYLSRIYTAAQAVQGVDSVEVKTFQRMNNPASSGLENGRLNMSRQEIARLDNDPNFPMHGVLRVIPKGGK